MTALEREQYDELRQRLDQLSQSLRLCWPLPAEARDDEVSVMALRKWKGDQRILSLTVACGMRLLSTLRRHGYHFTLRRADSGQAVVASRYVKGRLNVEVLDLAEGEYALTVALGESAVQEEEHPNVLRLHIPEATTALMERLRDAATPEEVRRACVSELGRVGGREATMALLERLRDDKTSAEVRSACAGVLGNIGGPEATTALRECLRDAATPADVRRDCANALGRIGGPEVWKRPLRKTAGSLGMVAAPAPRRDAPLASYKVVAEFHSPPEEAAEGGRTAELRLSPNAILKLWVRVTGLAAEPGLVRFTISGPAGESWQSSGFIGIEHGQGEINLDEWDYRLPPKISPSVTVSLEPVWPHTLKGSDRGALQQSVEAARIGRGALQAALALLEQQRTD